MNFGEALQAAKKGELITRSGWNGKGMFVFLDPGWVDLPLQDLLLDEITPAGVKSFYKNKFRNQTVKEGHKPIIKFTPVLCMKAADDTIVTGWLASQTDMLAEDWQPFLRDMDDGPIGLPPGGFRVEI
jgi:hypothetical protein